MRSKMARPTTVTIKGRDHRLMTSTRGKPKPSRRDYCRHMEFPLTPNKMGSSGSWERTATD
jgi:hypothetical protein